MRRQRNLLGPQGMGGMVSLWGVSSLVKSVQTGTVAFPAADSTVAGTINSVDTANAVLFFNGWRTTYGGTAPTYVYTRVTLTNATTVTFTRQGAAGTIATGSYTVVEFLPGILKSLQYGSIRMNAVVSNTATITTVNTAKSVVLHQGTTTFDTIPAQSENATTVILTNATTVTATREAPGNYDVSSNYAVMEFF